jgi:predicted acetyltransferase
MDEPNDVTLEVATARDAPLLANLLDLYMHDMSEFFPIDLDAEGRFGYPRLPLYWSELDTRFAFLIRSGGHVVGFAFVTRGSPASDDPAVLDMAEFFVLRRYRRSAIGKQAAVQLWKRFPGDWIVRVAESNRAGIPFWSRIIGEYTSGVMKQGDLPAASQPFRVFSFHS